MYDTHIVPLQIKACEIHCNPVLFWSDYLPYAVFIGRIEIWIGRTVDCSIGCIQIATARIWNKIHPIDKTGKIVEHRTEMETGVV